MSQMEGEELEKSTLNDPESADAALTAEMTLVTEQLKSSKEDAEKQLEELNKEVGALEQELEDANMKYEKALKFQSIPKDALDLLTFKLNEKNKENKKLIEENEWLREGIKTVTAELKTLKEEYEKDIDTFIVEVQEIADSYRQAAEFYTDSGLQAAAETASSRILSIESELKVVEEQLTAVVKEINTEVASNRAPHEMDLPLEKRRMVLKIFENECAESESKLNEMIEKKEALMTEIELMEKELSIDQDSMS